ncbi:MAG: hypothetical protein LBV28_03410 [Puniceicoccales bacterium]|jgi:DNA-binding transcriptional regulator/RsmH inhibitor MraZ|nr:hypothetical protein [Puniceicoccales bacterium]
MSTSGNAKLFTGKFSGRLDDKNRLTIPAAWRFESDGEGSYLAIFYPASGTILVLSPAMTQQIAAASSKVTLSDPAKLAAMTTLSEYSDTVSCDKVGRIILKDSILEKAHISREVTFRGAYSAFQISAPVPVPPDTTSPEAISLLNTLKELGL